MLQFPPESFRDILIAPASPMAPGPGRPAVQGEQSADRAVEHALSVVRAAEDCRSDVASLMALARSGFALHLPLPFTEAVERIEARVSATRAALSATIEHLDATDVDRRRLPRSDGDLVAQAMDVAHRAMSMLSRAMDDATCELRTLALAASRPSYRRAFDTDIDRYVRAINATWPAATEIRAADPVTADGTLSLRIVLAIPSALGADHRDVARRISETHRLAAVGGNSLSGSVILDFVALDETAGVSR